MKSLRSLPVPVILLAFSALMLVGFANAKEGELVVEAQLVWGTNDETSPNPKHKSVEPTIAKKLGDSPFKWKRYFEEERKTAAVSPTTSQKLEMSKNAVIEVKNLGKDVVEVKLIGDGKTVAKNKGPLADGEIMVIGGDAKNDTAWFIILRKVNDSKK
ncbi:MAG: hypothetical protein ACK4UN_07410 [Limisphaerales bacterium]